MRNYWYVTVGPQFNTVTRTGKLYIYWFNHFQDRMELSDSAAARYCASYIFLYLFTLAWWVIVPFNRLSATTGANFTSTFHKDEGWIVSMRSLKILGNIFFEAVIYLLWDRSVTLLIYIYLCIISFNILHLIELCNVLKNFSVLYVNTYETKLYYILITEIHISLRLKDLYANFLLYIIKLDVMSVKLNNSSVSFPVFLIHVQDLVPFPKVFFSSSCMVVSLVWNFQLHHLSIEAHGRKESYLYWKSMI